jgi:hypothetical protein
MKARLLPLNQNVLSGAFALMSDALAHASFAPTRVSTLGGVETASSAPRASFWDRLDRWAWRLAQKDREAYLAKAQNLAELEARIRDLDCVRGRFF